MLSNPMLENPVNLKAAQMLVKDESKYKRIIEALFLPSKCKKYLLVLIWQLAFIH
jgi:ubiquitin-protein ligase